jgi:CHAT domain-containing protein
MRFKFSFQPLVLSGCIVVLGLTPRSTTVLDSVVVSQADPSATSINRRIDQIERTWRGQYQSYFNTTPPTGNLTAEKISATLGRLSNQTAHRFALIYVFPQPNALELVLVIPNRRPVRRLLLEVPRSQLNQILQQFQAQVSHPILGRKPATPARQLYNWIVTPLEAELQAQEIDTLIFCVGSGLRSLPLAALHDGQHYLVEKYNLVLIPAFNLINPEYRSLRQARILAMGASEFTNKADLPAVPLELNAITQHLWQGEVFLNRDFTLENLRRQLATSRFGIVHLATHADFRAGAPSNSYIQLWQNERLSLDQIAQFDWRNLPVELLVLSACKTALGDRQAELGFAGLAYQTGVKSSLASLWTVSDISTLALMLEFYGQLAQPTVLTKADALRRAQIALLKGKVYVQDGKLHSSAGVLPLTEDLKKFNQMDLTSPYYWAAFTLVGSPW